MKLIEHIKISSATATISAWFHIISSKGFSAMSSMFTMFSMFSIRFGEEEVGFLARMITNIIVRIATGHFVFVVYFILRLSFNKGENNLIYVIFYLDAK